MDLHPIIVHFPVALLTIYSLMELIRNKKLLKSESWFYVKATFLIIGVIGALVALGSGDVAAHQLTDNNLRNVIEVHEGVAGATTTIFGILAIAYILSFIDKKLKKIITERIGPGLTKAYNILIKISNFISRTNFVIILAISGLVLLTLTGALGGLIVYGPNADPLTQLVYQLFFN